MGRPMLLAALLAVAIARKTKELQEGPMDKVVDMLKGMETALTKEAEEDAATNQKMDSWCKTTEEEQTGIVTSSVETTQLQTTAVQENTLLGERLQQEIRTLTKEIASNKATLAKAEVLRKDQAQSFTEDEKSLQGNIQAVSQAVAAFTAGSLLQLEGPLLLRLKQVVESNYAQIRAKTTRAERMMLDDFLKDPSQFSHGAGFLQRQGAEASGPAETVAGMLQEMLENFQRDLKAEQEEDGKLEASYQDLMSAKTKEVTAGEEQVTTKEQQKADAAEKVILGKEDVASAATAKAEAESLLATARDKCATSGAEYRDRLKTRTEEQTAVSKAVQVLTAKKSFLQKKELSAHLSFLQLQDKPSKSSFKDSLKETVSKAASVLATAGRRLENQELVTLSFSLQASGLDKVKDAIEGMLRALKQEQKDEVLKNSECKKELSENAASTDENTQLKETMQGKIGQLKQEISAVEAAIASLRAEGAKMAEELEAAKANRAKESSDFAAMMAEQRSTQKTLAEAKSVLEKVYEGVSLTQASATGPGFRGKTESFEVMELLARCSEEAARLEMEAGQGDQDSREAFEQLAQAMRSEMATMTKEVGNKSNTKADLESDMAEASQKIGLTEDELASLAETKAALKQSCDFVVKNFQTRQKSRAEEIQALVAAKTILP
ncbi:unnamed protein product [Effrenium voratum]|nr:unnamed protein product [Effrenium voratum]